MIVKNVVLVSLVALAAVAAADPTGSSLSIIPGAETGSAMLASASDGMSRYLAPDGPIQPGITAIGGVPMRAGELANNGLTSISSGLNRNARRLAQVSGQDGQIRMPGLDTAESMMPASFSQIGEQVHSMIRSKNNFIRGQAERGIEAANRLGQSMRNGLQSRSSPLEQAGQMFSNGSNKLRGQLERSLSGTMSHVSDIGQQFSGYGRTLSKGAKGVVDEVRGTGEQLMSQMQKNHEKNMSGLRNSMGQMGEDMQRNLGDIQKHASDAAGQLSSSLQSTLQAPKNLVQSMMSSKGGSGGRY